MESILTSIKKLIGIEEEDTSFDTDIIIHINSVFALLRRMGIGPSTGFSIEDSDNTWDEYITEGSDPILESVKTYLYLKTKLVFDPPTNSALLQTMKEEIQELEWSLNFEVDALADSKEG